MEGRRKTDTHASLHTGSAFFVFWLSSTCCWEFLAASVSEMPKDLNTSVWLETVHLCITSRLHSSMSHIFLRQDRITRAFRGE